MISIKILRIFTNGAAFGITMIFPGLSGGTLAIILGFYEELIESVNGFTKNFRKYIKFLLTFGFGAVVGLILFASVIQIMLERFSLPMMLFFIGLIIGVIPGIYRQAPPTGRFYHGRDLVIITIPIAALTALAHLNVSIGENDIATQISFYYMLYIGIIGIIAAAALLIPGLSGSFVLLLAGIYPLATAALSSLRELATNPTTELFVAILRILAPLAIGVILGIIFAARLIARLLAKNPRMVLLVVLGLMIGSIYPLFANPITLQSGTSLPEVFIGIIACAAGIWLSYKLFRPIRS